ncbi:MAG: RluA family pseudouridine synthase [Gemmatimonadaceae bacterium]|nr:RluA family pseudouridine synthase [Chitinophagaceae bacterium]
MNLKDITIFENENLIVLNKPAGLLSIPDRTQSAPSLKDHLKEKFGNIFTVHRLDRDTSGVIVFAKNESAHKSLSLQFEHRSTKKIYSGLVSGRPPEDAGVVEEAIADHYSQKGMMMISAKGKPALTHYQTIESFKHYSWLEFEIFTGRTHQIRLHAKHLGCPIVCDNLYGDGKPVLLSSIKRNFKLSKNADEERPVLNRLALHAARLSIAIDGNEVMEFEAPLPKDLRALLQQLKKWN